MTCIVGLVDKDGVVIGGDSAGSNMRTIVTREDVKVFRRGEFLIGYTTSFRMGQLLQYELIVPTQHQEKTDHEYMATDFIDAVRACFKTGGFATVSDNVETGGTFLVAYKGSLYEVDSDFQVGICRDGYATCGCGYQTAIGAVHVLTQLIHPKPSTEDIVRIALETSEYHNIGVRGPFVILRQNKQQRGNGS
jgi:20S proteasome alpha/beta subunit